MLHFVLCSDSCNARNMHGHYFDPWVACREISASSNLLGHAQLRSAGSHQRSILFPHGNKKYTFVKNGNRLASRFALVMWYSLAMGCVFLLEQPHGSLCELHPRMALILAAIQIFKCGIWGGLYASDRSQATPKRHVLYSNDEKLLRELSMAAGHMTKEDMSSFTGDPLVKRQKREGGGESWSGVPGVMTNSQLGPWSYLLVLSLCMHSNNFLNIYIMDDF